MDRDTLAETIFRRMAAPYGDAITPALTQQLRISANLAAEDILEEMARPKRRSRTLTPKHLHPREVEERDATIADMYRSGLTLNEIGAEVDMSAGSVWRVLKRQNVPRRKPGQQPFQISQAG